MNTSQSSKSHAILWLAGAVILSIAPVRLLAQTPASSPTPTAAPAQDPQSASPATGSTPAAAAPAANAAQNGMPTIKRESKLVLVDAIVTDKKGAYVRDLTQKDFKVYEDNKEQQVTGFSFGSDI